MEQTRQIDVLLRDRIVLPLLSTRAMQKRLTRKTSQLDMNYRGWR